MMENDPWGKEPAWKLFALSSTREPFPAFRQKLAMFFLGQKRFEAAKNQFFMAIGKKLKLDLTSCFKGDGFAGRYYCLTHKKSGFEVRLYQPSLPLFGNEVMKVPVVIRYKWRRQRKIAIRQARDLGQQLGIRVKLELA